MSGDSRWSSENASSGIVDVGRASRNSRVAGSPRKEDNEQILINKCKDKTTNARRNGQKDCLCSSRYIESIPD
jgi:hypothetical protein